MILPHSQLKSRICDLPSIAYLSDVYLWGDPAMDSRQLSLSLNLHHKPVLRRDLLVSCLPCCVRNMWTTTSGRPDSGKEVQPRVHPPRGALLRLSPCSTSPICPRCPIERVDFPADAFSGGQAARSRRTVDARRSSFVCIVPGRGAFRSLGTPADRCENRQGRLRAVLGQSWPLRSMNAAEAFRYADPLGLCLALPCAVYTSASEQEMVQVSVWISIRGCNICRYLFLRSQT
ncbi:hypothetical protein C8Q77DRAFT_492257 [Trametes polyzona]|nr:hypothetical protein C8Q77DRAFT_492257 [Trametes polyzona]